jgi:hypothetical protein
VVGLVLVVVVLVVLLVVVVLVVLVARVVVVAARVVVVVVPPPAAPVQAVPFRAKPAGVAGVPVPWKPKVAVPPVGTVPFQPAFPAVTAAADWVTVAFQADVTASPPVKFQVRVQALTASPRLVTVTAATKPPDHWEVTA